MNLVRVEDIERITIRTHEACIRIIDKQGPLNNPADRDHCIQYMVAVPLIFGRLTASDYEDGVAGDPRIDALRRRIVCVEDEQLTAVGGDNHLGRRVASQRNVTR
jgi:2-methylcitrate dehydratase